MRPTQKLSPSNPMNYRGAVPPLGLGTAVQRVIHASLNIIPMPAQTRQTIKGCAGCRRRRDTLNRWVPNINPFH